MQHRIQEDMKLAMKARDSQRLGAIRLLMAAIKQCEIDQRISLDDVQIQTVINKMIKQRRDSISQFEKANPVRLDLIEQENFEIQVLLPYLPVQLSKEEIEALIDAQMIQTPVNSIKDMGLLIAQLKPKLQGLADMSVVSAMIKNKLTP